MNMKLISCLALSVFVAFAGAEEEGDQLTVLITNIPGAKGELLVGLYETAKSFTDSPMEQSPKIKLTTAEDQMVTFNDLKPGKYAIAVIHDVNENGKLDRNFLGMPKEPLAFSVIKKIPKGKPKFDACAFDLGEEPVKMTIALVTK